ncbi:mannitol-specific PTS transporter subunit IIC [Proteiniphilum sp. UBA5384]|uniref:mannitol-specific PTS transporter subunit IIC n=1 Tax=Proteiniphilum sp. UBA5384 TaxID=1947279 RepID=UPI0025F59B78|nr:mannitol-specific PTS transporter subunit IIC [Proteiniphilum sp. UBA5384]
MKNSLRTHVQSFGSKLSSMIMPNIGAFIAWGLITAIFIPAGWWPNTELAKLVAPMLRYLLPLLIAYTAGSNVAGVRGGIMGTIATIGVIEGSSVPMFLGAMVMGPLAGYVIKWFDRATKNKVKSGFEMLVNNFSIGILGMACAITGFLVVGPVMLGLTGILNSGVEFVLNEGVLPLVAVFIEPGKILFLNNAINHGILTPLGIEQARETGYSVLFLLEANPGPGLGILLAYMLRGDAEARKTAPASSVILLFGGIHEIYFPYVLMRPALIIAAILGSASAMAYYQIIGGGLVSAASPGSIISIMAMSPRGMTLQIVLGIVIAAAVSFLVAYPLVGGKSRKSLQEAEKEKKMLKDYGKSPCKIVFACEAGMGSSAMGATGFMNRIKQEGITVINTSIDTIPADTDIVVCQSVFVDRVSDKIPNAEIVVIHQFLSDPALDELANRLSPVKQVLTPGMIVLGAAGDTRKEAIKRAGKLLVDAGYVNNKYVDKMLEREQIISTYIGMGIAVPHGTSGSHEYVISSGISIIQYPEGVDFDGEKAYLVIGIAGKDGKHLDILSSLSSILSDEEILEKVKNTDDKMIIYNVLSNIN